MGVNGLTTYVDDKSNILEKFELRECILIIDGYSLAAMLYNSCPKIHSVFGGDYDKYANWVGCFFDLLKTCDVTPIVICDGGYEKIKFQTIRLRCLEKVRCIAKVTPNKGTSQCFSLMLRHVLKEKAQEMGITLLQSDFEADSEIAALAKKLNGIVLSSDSDFFIFDVKYIPMSTICFNNTSRKNKKGKLYVPCQIFLVEKFLKSCGGLPKIMLPLLATVLGNDYIKLSKFEKFYDSLKLTDKKNIKPSQNRINAVVKWLKREDYDSALSKILNCLGTTASRQRVKYVIKGYTKLETPLYTYLPQQITDGSYNTNEQALMSLVDKFDNLDTPGYSEETSEAVNMAGLSEEYLPKKITDMYDNTNEQALPSLVDKFDNHDTLGSSEETTDAGNVPRLLDVEEGEDDKRELEKEDEEEIDTSDDEGDESSADDEGDESSADDEGDESSADDTEKVIIDYLMRDKIDRTKFPEWLLLESRRGNVCPAINTLIRLKTYFYTPQVEEYSEAHSGSATVPILQVIAGLLGLDLFTYWARVQSRYEVFHVSAISSNSKLSFPKLTDLNDLSYSERKAIVSETLKINDNSILECFPPSWQLYVMSIVYWAKMSSEPIIKPSHLHSLVLSAITINVIGSKIGQFSQKQLFLKRYGTQLQKLSRRTLQKSTGVIYYPSLKKVMAEVTKEDCIVALEVLISYFQVDQSIKRNPKRFSRNSIHLFAQFQSTFQLSVTLNSLLLLPYKRSHLGMFHNGTFLFNLSNNLNSRTNILAYVQSILSKAPTVLNLYNVVYNTLKNLIPSAPQERVKKTKKKQIIVKQQLDVVEKQMSEQGSEDDEFVDKNNKYYSLLKLPE